MKKNIFFIALCFSILYVYSQPSKMLAPTPPMGWNSWNFFEKDLNEKILFEIVDAMAENGMQDAGYKYVIIDDFWVGGRDSKNRLYPDPIRFPNGIKYIADYVHSKGFKLGIYSTAAEYTCGGVTASLGFEELDAKTFADWGVDYLKYDYCHAPDDLETAFLRYKKMGDALRKSGRDIVYAICEWGQRQPWLWAKAAGGNLWRTTYDSRDCWESNQPDPQTRGGIVEIFDLQKNIFQYNGPDAWNDPDMLMVGLFGKGKSSSLDGKLQGCSQDEYNSNFALWCMLAAPLIVNSDIRNIDKISLKLLTNKYLISINQDSLGKQAQTIVEKDSLQVLKKELAGGNYAVCILNRSEKQKKYSFSLKSAFDIWFPAAVINVWDGKISRNATSVSGNLNSHACDVFIVKKNQK